MNRNFDKYEAVCVRHGKAYLLYANMGTAVAEMYAAMRNGTKMSFSWPYTTRVSDRLHSLLKRRKTGLARSVRPRTISWMNRADRRDVFGPLAVW